MHSLCKKTERALKAYHGSEQKLAGLPQTPGSTEQVRGRRGPPSREQPRPGGHQENVCRARWEMGLPGETTRQNGNSHNQVPALSKLIKLRKPADKSASSQCFTLVTGSISHQPPQPPGPLCVREERRRVAQLSPYAGVGSVRTLKTGLAPGRRALSSRAGRQPEEPEPFSACEEAEVGRWKGCQLLDGKVVQPAALTLGNSKFLPQMKCAFCKLALVGFLPTPRLYKQNQR